MKASPAECRIAFLDGLRGIAIAWVVLFHTYVRWPEFMPFGDRFTGVPALVYGWLGVQLFFMISGFVILMTLERTTSLGQFMLRRWLRLFPAMLACSVLIYASAPLFPARPAGMPTLMDLLPGLTFIDPNWISLALGIDQGLLEGVFWSLFVEMKFYVVGGLLYFTLGGNKMIGGLVALFLVSAVSRAVGNQAVTLICEALGLRYFGWFAAGAMFYRYVQRREPVRFGLALLLAVSTAAMQDGYQKYPSLFALSVVAVFAAGVAWPPARRALESRTLVALGCVSYPLYLVHENILVAATVEVAGAAPQLPAVLMPVAPIALVVAIAWIVAHTAEPWLRSRIERIATRLVAPEGASTLPR